MEHSNLDRVLYKLGWCGRYQLTQLALILVSVLPGSHNILSYIFVGYDGPHSCTEITNTSSLNTYSDYVGNDSSISYGECKIVLQTNTSQGRMTEHMSCIAGNTYNEHKQVSIVSEWDLVCERASMSELTQTVFVLGQAAGGILCSSMSDRFGRKPTYIVNVFMLMVTGFVLSFAPNYSVFVAFRFLAGIFQQGTDLTIATMSLETVPTEKRFKAGTFGSMLWGSALVTLAPLAYLLRNVSWRYLQLAVSLTAAYSLILPFTLEETLRWLEANGKTKEIERILRKAAKANKVSEEEVLKVYFAPRVDTDVSKMKPLYIDQTIIVHSEDSKVSHDEFVKSSVQQNTDTCAPEVTQEAGDDTELQNGVDIEEGGGDTDKTILLHDNVDNGSEERGDVYQDDFDTKYLGTEVSLPKDGGGTESKKKIIDVKEDKKMANRETSVPTQEDLRSESRERSHLPQGEVETKNDGRTTLTQNDLFGEETDNDTGGEGKELLPRDDLNPDDEEKVALVQNEHGTESTEKVVLLQHKLDVLKLTGNGEANGRIVSPKATKKYTLLDILRSKLIFKNAVIMWYCWIVDSLVYYGLYMTSSALSGNRYLNYFLNSVVEVPASLLIFLTLERLGRKRPSLLFHTTAGISLLVAVLLRTFAGNFQSALILAVILSLVGKLTITTGFGILFIYTPELFPTNLRNAGLGAASSVSRLGGMVAPFAGTLEKTVAWAPGAIFSGMCLLAGFLIQFLPETRGHELPLTLEEIREWYKMNLPSKKQKKGKQLQQLA